MSEKSPAFQFYPNDFVGGAPGTMEPDETHVYVWLLCLDWNQNGFIFDEKILAKWCRISRKRFTAAWTKVAECFEEQDGRWFNQRLAKERAKQDLWRAKSSEGGRRSAEQRAKGGARVVEAPHQGSFNTPFPSSTSVTTTAKTTTSRAARASGAEDSARPPRPAAVRASWLAPIAAVWEAKKGAFAWGKAGKLLKPLHDGGQSSDEIATRLAKYLDTTDAKYVSLARFAETYADHVPFRFKSPPMVDGLPSDELHTLLWGHARSYVLA